MLTTLDQFLLNRFIAKLKPGFFKYKLSQISAILYISLFPLPRRFIINYFKGTGEKLIVNTKYMILSNPLVLKEIFNKILDKKYDEDKIKCIPINQCYLSDPNYRYSIGSFNLECKLKGTYITISLTSEYKYTVNNDRVTKHVHNWLHTFCEQGKANSFFVEGTSWYIAIDKLKQYENKIKKNASLGNISGL